MATVSDLPVRPAKEAVETPKQHSILDSSAPVLLPEDDLLFLPEPDFQASIRELLAQKRKATTSPEPAANLKRRASADDKNPRPSKSSPAKSAFIDGLLQHESRVMTTEELADRNQTLTANLDVTNISSKNPLVDLFYDLAESTEGEKLKPLLENAWKEDALMTVKLVFNARSIHLGKSNKIAAYKAMGWLAENHPLTLLNNLKWLVRPVIEKKSPKLNEKGKAPEGPDASKKSKAKDEDEDFEMVEADESKPEDPAKAQDVRFGVSHGYWKDLLNLLALAANDQLNFSSNPSELLTQKADNTYEGKKKRTWDAGEAKQLRKARRLERHQRALQKLEHDQFYRALHATVARLFAAQMQEDKTNLSSGNKADLKKITFAGKWAPSMDGFHDEHTFVASSIAEILFPKPEEICPDATNRELYLRHAREQYRRQFTSPLRKALSVVEREIAAKKFDEINYERVPSLAMDRYSGLFIEKDQDRFNSYLDKVAGGTAKISGAVLLPSTLVLAASGMPRVNAGAKGRKVAQLTANLRAEAAKKVANGQWNALVTRIRESGVLESSIAVCDVSGSMTWTTFKDGTQPIHSAIGLSLLLSEITAPPFGGTIISFSERPQVYQVGGETDSRTFIEKVQYMDSFDVGGNTNFTAVFEKLILPMAQEKNLKQEEMVKNVFVFSDMQFDEADTPTERWTSSFERIKAKYKAAGYEMPNLIFWNLNGNNTEKPTTMEDTGTALVSGYSQGLLKVFMDRGGFEADEEEVVEEEVVEEGAKGEPMVEVRKEKAKMDPLTVVKKAVSHTAYSMLEVID
ncbi:hypothetical protein BCR34DRAFT_627532 [Clohesyomyces aquaticus]|uniref:Uncharacterized protein n=1 Tax=Clohesyomyces aquaticus TaxID=1231657 RepID=A0A1Y1YWN4_9PLEO|nr:hypothetical protein BCR34DRAFT_627532 [Clohesyomyces aquaticus]